MRAEASTAAARRARPTRLRRVLTALAVVVALVLALFGWAWTATDTSVVARVLSWREADIGDQQRFPSRTIPTAERPSDLPGGPTADLQVDEFGGHPVSDLSQALSQSGTRAFIVIHDDRIVDERYFAGSGPAVRETSFSVAKSFVSTLIGIATERGEIGSIDDPVTEYVPELAARDPRFARITLRDLLTMTSGLAYHESGLPWPFGDDTYTYLGTDLRQVALEHSRIEEPPGQDWLYNNYNPLLLGLVLERATGTSVSGYMSSVLWQPLGADRDATWSLDSTSSGFEKMESGLNATARDYARFGEMMLHGGWWNGHQIVSHAWVDAATAQQTTTDYRDAYGYFWWVDGQRPGNYYALGNLGQYIYVAPDDGTVIVRLGSDWGQDTPAWVDLFHDLTDQLNDS